MRKKLTLAGLSALFVAGVVTGEKPLDSAWKPKPGDGFGRLARPLEVECTRFPVGNVTTYRMTTFEKTAVKATESDDRHRTTVEIDRVAELEVERDKKGRTVSVEVRINGVLHIDLNADGVFDGAFDSATKQLRIILDGRPVEVEYALTALSTRSARSPGHETTYVFDGVKWRTK